MDVMVDGPVLGGWKTVRNSSVDTGGSRDPVRRNNDATDLLILGWSRMQNKSAVLVCSLSYHRS